MNADAHQVAALDLRKIQGTEGFIHQVRIAEVSWRRARQHIQPSRRNHRCSERDVAGIDQVYFWICRHLPSFALRELRNTISSAGIGGSSPKTRVGCSGWKKWKGEKPAN